MQVHKAPSARCDIQLGDMIRVLGRWASKDGEMGQSSDSALFMRNGLLPTSTLLGRTLFDVISNTSKEANV